MREGALVLIKGRPSKKRVRPGKFFWYWVLRPQIRLEIGSSPAFTFCVSGRSESRSREPPIVQSRESWCSTVVPANVFACMLKSVLFSKLTRIGMPEESKLSFRIRT